MAKLLIFKEEVRFGTLLFVKVWLVPKSNAFPEGIKYRISLIYKNQRILGYDNSSVESDHKHFSGEKMPIKFEGITKLYDKFMEEANQIIDNLIGGENDKGKKI